MSIFEETVTGGLNVNVFIIISIILFPDWVKVILGNSVKNSIMIAATGTNPLQNGLNVTNDQLTQH